MEQDFLNKLMGDGDVTTNALGWRHRKVRISCTAGKKRLNLVHVRVCHLIFMSTFLYVKITPIDKRQLSNVVFKSCGQSEVLRVVSQFSVSYHVLIRNLQ